MMLENGVTKGDKAKNPFNLKHFDLNEYEIRAAGCTADDQLKDLTLIIQTDHMDSKGEHYQVVYMDLGPDCHHVEFFDPYELIPIQEGTRSLMEAVKSCHWHNNEHKLQDI